MNESTGLGRVCAPLLVLLIAACGGHSVGPVTPTGAGTPPAATASIAADPASISAGGSSMLTWTSSNASACTATGAWSGTQSTSGTLTVSPAVTSSYSLDCRGSGGPAQTQTATVTVAAAAAVPTVTLTATPVSVASGATSMLTWTSTGASSCTATGAWSGNEATSGTFITPALTAAATYTLACSGTGGAATQSATVNVAAAVAAPTAVSASTVGPYAVNTYTDGIPVGAHYTIPKIYYPTAGPAPYPGLIFITGLHSSYTDPVYTVVINGQTVVEADVTQWGTLLASHGFILMFIDATNYDAAPPERATALLEAVDSLAAENTRAGSPIAGRLQAQNIAVGGHSFGGAGALYAADGRTNSRIKAVLALSPVPQGPYFPNDPVPSIVICGQDDPYMNDYQGLYDSLPATTSRLLAEFKTSAEFDSMHSIALTPLGTHTTDPLVARLGLSFLELYLAGDVRYQQFLVNAPAVLLSFDYHP
jgi:pimeloyl-ACP methyl ester carboxylesterase